MSNGTTFAFIIPRFGEGIAGGAETLVGNLARALHERGQSVTVLTTCARDNRTWANEFPAGEDTAYGVRVLRFPVGPRDLERWIPLQIRLSEGMTLSLEEQLTWMEESVNAPALYEYLAAHGASFEYCFFAPYLFGTTFWGSLITPERSVLIPCLHDECYAHLPVMGSMMRQVAGCLFNARPEMELAHSLYGSLPGGVVGMGFEPFEDSYRQSLTPLEAFTEPYLLYLGRKETGKNVHLLIDFFIAAKNRGLFPSELKLVIAGGGSFEDLHRPHARARNDIVDVAHTCERDKHRLVRHASVLVQPSRNESFSIVMMEAWLLRTPVLVNAHCPVTRAHVIESQGGLYFANEEEFAATVMWLLENPHACDTFGRLGEQYVREQYGWKSVLKRFDEAVRAIALSAGASREVSTA